MASDNTLHADVLDFGLDRIKTRAASGVLQVWIIKENVITNSFDPNTGYSTLSNAANKLGDHTYATSEVQTIATIGSGDLGRKITFPAISGATVDVTGNATHYAIVDMTGSSERILATGDLSAAQSVTQNNTFSLATFDIKIPAPA